MSYVLCLTLAFIVGVLIVVLHERKNSREIHPGVAYMIGFWGCILGGTIGAFIGFIIGFYTKEHWDPKSVIEVAVVIGSFLGTVIFTFIMRGEWRIEKAEPFHDSV